MSKKDYVIEHDFSAVESVDRVRPYLDQLVEKYGMTLKQVSDTEFRVSRTGVSAQLLLEDRRATATVELSFLLEKLVRPRMEQILEEKVKPELQKMQA